MYISDNEKLQIIRELAQGSIHPLPGMTASISKSDQDFDPLDYLHFDDFAQRTACQEQHDAVTRAFFDQLKQRGLSNLNLGS